MLNPLNPETLSALKEFDKPGQNGFLSEIITAYLEDTAVRFLAIRAAHREADAAALSKVAHAIKGSSLNVGADGLASLMQALEKDGKAGILCPPERISEAENQFHIVSGALTALL